MTNEPGDLYTYAWANESNGALTPAEARIVKAGIRRGYVNIAKGLVAWPFRRTAPAGALPLPPDSRLAKMAEEAARDQGPALEGHGYRTWLAGRALAEHDGVALDDEEFYVAALLHDAGLVNRRPGQDFTIRSAQIVRAVCERAGASPAATERAVDACVSNATPGVPAATYPLGHYVAYGATADLAGLWMWHLPRQYLRRAYEAFPANGVHGEIVGLIRREAEDVPDGRFAILHRYGLALTVKFSPTRRYH